MNGILSFVKRLRFGSGLSSLVPADAYMAFPVPIGGDLWLLPFFRIVSPEAGGETTLFFVSEVVFAHPGGRISEYRSISTSLGPVDAPLRLTEKICELYGHAPGSIPDDEWRAALFSEIPSKFRRLYERGGNEYARGYNPI